MSDTTTTHHVPKYKNLMPQQSVFVTELLKCWDGPTAARKAGYPAKEAAAKAQELLGKEKVQAAIKEGQRNQSGGSVIVEARVLQEIATIAFFDTGDIYDSITGEQLSIHEIPEHARRAINSVESIEFKNGTKKTIIRFHDKVKSLKMFCQCLGMLKSPAIARPSSEEEEVRPAISIGIGTGKTMEYKP